MSFHKGRIAIIVEAVVKNESKIVNRKMLRQARAPPSPRT